MFSWPSSSPDRGYKSADETKSRFALQKRVGLSAVLQKSIKGKKTHLYYKVKITEVGKCQDRVSQDNSSVSRVHTHCNAA